MKDLVGTADLRRNFLKSFSTNWLFKLYEITEIIKDTVRKNRLQKNTGKVNEVFLK